MELNYSVQKCLILVPHPDDETNIAGNLIHDLRKAGTEVYVAYTTNGDWKYPACIRQKEALSALYILGKIKKDHVFFFGYGDSYFDEFHSHIFYSNEKAVISKSGHSETYGTEIIQDFSFLYRGHHSPYCKEAYCRDLMDLILWIKPDLIVCSDLDEHPDHRMLTLCFDKVMGKILKEDKDYRPKILKAFAYSQAYGAAADLYDNPNKTSRPEIGKTKHYEYDIIDRSIYEWNKRISLSVSERYADRRLFLNRKAKALSKHISQPIVFRAEGIINSDEVFWQRRTDSLTYSAKIRVSSGNAAYLNDFMLYNTADIDRIIPDFDDYLWTPDTEDQSPEIAFEWDTPQLISQIRVFGDLNNEIITGPMTVQFDQGDPVILPAIPRHGCLSEVTFDTVQTKKCVIHVNPGTAIAECEIFGMSEEKLNDISSPDYAGKAIRVTQQLNRLWFLWMKVRSVVWKLRYGIKEKCIGWLMRNIMKKRGRKTEGTKE